ncbi:MAG: methyltransferase domain-containing protein [Myxococcaceae bacterium]|nr:methyltransferase domain-containing protein [Myxococcaceae bacterium]
MRLNDAIAARIGGRPEELYLEHLKSTRGAHELAELMASISVYKTDLFRDEGQLEAVRSYALLPKAKERRPLRVWSAGCATGEEVATLLILLSETGAHPESTVLGSDISNHALGRAQAQRFSPELMRRVPEVLRGRYFHKAQDGAFELVGLLKERASFVRHNLMDVPYPLPPGGGGFDLIFCRNVLIYFTQSAFEKTIACFAERLAPNGVLVLSAAEPLLQPQKDLELVRHAQSFMYVKRDPSVPPPKPSAPPSAFDTGPRRAVTGEFRIAPAVGVPAPPAPARRPITQELPVVKSPEQEHEHDGEKLFQLVLEWAAAGASDTETESGLKRCLYLEPSLACARYLLGMLYENKGNKADAASEYRRAMSLLREGRAVATPFFLNDARLKVVVERALARLGYPDR